MNEPASLQPPAQYKDEDLVYVDPSTRTVVGLVEWSTNGKPKAKPMPSMEEVDEEEVADTKNKTDAKGKVKGKDRPPRRRVRRQRYYPWGTYRSMKRIYKIEGKVRDKDENRKTLDEVMQRALQEPFWD